MIDILRYSMKQFEDQKLSQDFQKDQDKKEELKKSSWNFILDT